MAYVTGQEVIDRHKILNTWNFGATSVASELVFYAEAEIDSRLAGYFTTPFTPAHPTVKDLTIDLSYLKALYSRNLDEWEVRKEYFDARIDRIIGGTEAIMTASGTALFAQAANREWSSTEGYHPVFSMLDEESALSAVDSTQLSDEAAERGG